MTFNPIVTFPRSPRERQDQLHQNRAAPAVSAPRWFSALRRAVRRLIAVTGWVALRTVLTVALLAARLGRVMFSVLPLDFLGKLWLPWGQASAWGAALEFGLSFAIFCVLSAVTAAWASPLRPQVVRLPLRDRLLLAPRR